MRGGFLVFVLVFVAKLQNFIRRLFSGINSLFSKINSLFSGINSLFSRTKNLLSKIKSLRSRIKVFPNGSVCVPIFLHQGKILLKRREKSEKMTKFAAK